MTETEKEIPIEVQPQQLSADAIAGIIENFILREGSDYGLVEATYEKKAEQIRKQIDSGEIKIIFDQTSETISLLTKHQFKQLTQVR